jgi:cell wall-associated NlpC family hydrolase
VERRDANAAPDRETPARKIVRLRARAARVQRAIERMNGAARQAVAFAMALIGKPYLRGAAGPSAYDCSGLMLAAYRSAGVYLPRVSRDYIGAVRPTG